MARRFEGSTESQIRWSPDEPLVQGGADAPVADGLVEEVGQLGGARSEGKEHAVAQDLALQFDHHVGPIQQHGVQPPVDLIGAAGWQPLGSPLGLEGVVHALQRRAVRGGEQTDDERVAALV
jgi:hypothetical protein